MEFIRPRYSALNGVKGVEDRKEMVRTKGNSYILGMNLTESQVSLTVEEPRMRATYSKENKGDAINSLANPIRRLIIEPKNTGKIRVNLIEGLPN